MSGDKNETMLAEQIRSVFTASFSSDCLLVRSPGRINLIGEHTDYNAGFVLPAAIDKAVYLGIGLSGSSACRYVAVDLDAVHEDDVKQLQRIEGHWSAYLNGVIEQFQKSGFEVPGLHVVVGGDIPVGAGLSSSAAVECAMAMAIKKLLGLPLDKKEMVKMAQRAENEFVGVQCGIMDQFASMFGKKNHVIQLDCRSLDFTYRPFEASGLRLVLLDTQVKHSLASSAYNTRRQQCEQGVAWIAEHHPEVTHLRDATEEMLQQWVAPKDQEVYTKCLYVVQEINRLLQGCEDLEQANWKAFGKKMYQTHEGLSKWYEVSCAELDFLVSSAQQYPSVLGARMMGGGFGGCTINLIEEKNADDIIQEISTAYAAQFGRKPLVYPVSIEDGTSVLQ